MLEEHVKNVNDGFLFRRELRTHTSVGGDDPNGLAGKSAEGEAASEVSKPKKPKSESGKSEKSRKSDRKSNKDDEGRKRKVSRAHERRQQSGRGGG